MATEKTIASTHQPNSFKMVEKFPVFKLRRQQAPIEGIGALRRYCTHS